jgi:hypothetical protein
MLYSENIQRLLEGFFSLTDETLKRQIIDAKESAERLHRSALKFRKQADNEEVESWHHLLLVKSQEATWGSEQAAKRARDLDRKLARRIKFRFLLEGALVGALIVLSFYGLFVLLFNVLPFLLS